MKIMNKLNNEKGSAILIVLAIMAILSTVAIMAVDQSNDEISMSFRQLHEEQAFYVAEAGIKMALVELDNDDTWRTGYVDKSFGSGVFTVVITDNAVDSTLADTIRVTSSSLVDGASNTVEVLLLPGKSSIFAYAMFAKDGIVLDRNTCTNSFNSDSGGYALTVLDSLGDIGSNGTIVSSKDIVFGGSIHSATPGGITLGANNTVNGDTTSTADTVQLDVIPDTEYDWAKSTSPAPLGISGAGYVYDAGTQNLTGGSASSIILSSGTYYFNDITLGQDSQLLLAPGAQVTIYVNGDINFNQNSTANVGGNPSDLIVFSRGSLLQFDQGNLFYGAFYGPDAHIQYDQTTQVYGSLVGGTIKLDKGACFHYDRNLGNYTHGAGGSLQMVAWREL